MGFERNFITVAYDRTLWQYVSMLPRLGFTHEMSYAALATLLSNTESKRKTVLGAVTIIGVLNSFEKSCMDIFQKRNVKVFIFSESCVRFCFM